MHVIFQHLFRPVVEPMLSDSFEHLDDDVQSLIKISRYVTRRGV